VGRSIVLFTEPLFFIAKWVQGQAMARWKR